MSQQGNYSGNYFGSYQGALGGAVAADLSATLSGAGAIIALLSTGQPYPTAAEDFSPHGRIRRGRHAADFQPDWLLEVLNPPKPPRRTRKRREEDLVMLA